MAVTDTLLQASIIRAKAIGADTQIKKALIPHADAARVLLENQTTKYTVLENKDQDLTARLIWLDLCGGSVRNCTPKCTITGSGFSTVKEDKVLSLCKEATPDSIGAEVFRTNELNQVEVIAEKITRQKKLLDEWLAQQVLVYMKSFAGPNLYPGGYTANGGTTYIPDSDWNMNLATYLQLVAIYNEMPESFKISNEQFFIPYTNAMYNANNLNGQGDAAKAAYIALNLNFDLFNFAKASIDPEDMFIVEPGAMSLVTKSRFQTTPYYEDGTPTPQWRWSEMSSVLPGVEYEFYLQKVCAQVGSTAQEEIITNVQGMVRYGIFQNPLGCSYTRNGVTGQTTGIISLTKGTYVAP